MFNKDMFGKLQGLQAEMERARQRLNEIMVTGEAGAGLVKVTASANRKVMKIQVDPSIVDKSDVETLTDLIAAAVNQALEIAEVRAREEIQKVSQNILPGMNLGDAGL